jgi:hypothetical protein
MRKLTPSESNAVHDIATRKLVVILITMAAAVQRCTFEQAQATFQAPDFKSYLSDPRSTAAFCYVWEGLIGQAALESDFVDDDTHCVHVVASVIDGRLDTRIYIHDDEDADD